MLIATSVVLSVIMFVLSVKPAYAIIVVIPAILIPIVQIVVWIVTAIATPIIGLSALYFKFKNKPVFKGVLLGLVILILIALVVGLSFKFLNPQRPIY